MAQVGPGGRRGHAGRRIGAVLVGATLLATAMVGCTVKPQPLGPAELGAYAADKLRRVGSDQPLPGPRIDLYEAFARALKYNLDQRVEIMQTRCARRAELRQLSMLPNFVANSAYAGATATPPAPRSRC